MRVRLSRFAKFKPLALIAVSAMLHACSLPAVRPEIEPRFAEGQMQVKTLAMMPVDFGLTRKSSDGISREDPEIEDKLGQRLRRGLVEAFKRRGYLFGALIKPDGSAGDVQLMYPDDLAQLRVQIHNTARSVSIERGAYLPQLAASWTQQLGEHTGTDATVYARGWAYIDPDSGSGVGTVLAVLFVVFIVFVLVAALAGASKSKKSKSKSCKSRSRSRKSSRKSRHTIRPKRGSSHSSRPPNRPSNRPSGRSSGRATCRGKTSRSGRSSCSPGRSLARGMSRTARAFVEAASEVDVHVVVNNDGVAAPQADMHYSEPETWTEVIETEIKSPGWIPESTSLGLSISLVHNPTGQVLWHGAQRFDITAKDDYKLQDLMEHFLEKMPRAPEWPVAAAVTEKRAE